MATSSITSNFRIDDPKAAKAFVEAFIRHSQNKPAQPSSNFRFVTTVEEMDALKAQLVKLSVDEQSSRHTA